MYDHQCDEEPGYENPQINPRELEDFQLASDNEESEQKSVSGDKYDENDDDDRTSTNTEVFGTSW
jgi:hypothetical protein